jgi:hypothetical protein
MATGRHLSNPKTCRLLALPNTGLRLLTDRRLLTGRHPSSPNMGRRLVTGGHPALTNTVRPLALLNTDRPLTLKGRWLSLRNTDSLLALRNTGSLPAINTVHVPRNVARRAVF